MSFTLDLTDEQEQLREKTHAFAHYRASVIGRALRAGADTDPLDQRMEAPR